MDSVDSMYSNIGEYVIADNDPNLNSQDAEAKFIRTIINMIAYYFHDCIVGIHGINENDSDYFIDTLMIAAANADRHRTEIKAKINDIHKEWMTGWYEDEATTRHNSYN